MIYYITKYEMVDKEETYIFIEKKLYLDEMGERDESHNLCKINLPDSYLEEIEKDNNCKMSEKQFLKLL